jgi:hypothetical protein
VIFVQYMLIAAGLVVGLAVGCGVVIGAIVVLAELVTPKEREKQ